MENVWKGPCVRGGPVPSAVALPAVVDGFRVPRTIEVFGSHTEPAGYEVVSVTRRT